MRAKIIYACSFLGGLVLTFKAIEYAKSLREYDAVGGEYLVLPLCIMVAYLINSIIDVIGGIYGRYEDIRELSAYRDKSGRTTGYEKTGEN